MFLVFVGSFFVMTLQMAFLLTDAIDGSIPDLAHVTPGMWVKNAKDLFEKLVGANGVITEVLSDQNFSSKLISHNRTALY